MGSQLSGIFVYVIARMAIGVNYGINFTSVVVRVAKIARGVP